MGMYKSTFVGPCIKLKNPTQNSTRQGERCANVSCKNHKRETMGEKYCGKCGSTVEHYSIPIPLSIFQLLENEGVDVDTFHIIHSDMHEFPEKNVTFLTDNTTSGDGNRVLTGKKVNSSVKDFYEKFVTEIDMLERYYESVLVEFVIFTYYS